MIRKLTFIITSFLLLYACQKKDISIEKTSLNIDTGSLLQAISIVDNNTAWVSGHKATFARTLDGGSSWEVYTHSSDTLQFRDIHAFDQSNVVLMSAGPGASSRIYLFNTETSMYTEVYVMPHAEGFLNTIEFWDEKKGIAFGDSFDGQLFVLKTLDGGRSWDRIDPALLPTAGKGEGGFAASGTCISVMPGGKAWIATGAGGNSRILYTSDYGTTWTEFPNPIIKGEAAGVTSINMLNDQTGIIVGGDLAITDEYTDNVAITQDGGLSWALAKKPITKGAFYGSSIVDYKGKPILIASGPKGIDYSTNWGATWVNLDTANYWAVRLDARGFGYATGTKGKILKLVIEEL